MGRLAVVGGADPLRQAGGRAAGCAGAAGRCRRLALAAVRSGAAGCWRWAMGRRCS